MGKRVAITLGAVLIVAVAFGAGWLSRGQSLAPIRDEPRSPAPASKADEVEYWRYPGATEIGAVRAAPPSSLYLATYTTADGLDGVAAWYSERFRVTLEPNKNTGLTALGEPPVATARGNDSFQPPTGPGLETPPRAVKIGVGSRSSPGSFVTVVINRLDGENRTHIIVSFDKR